MTDFQRRMVKEGRCVYCGATPKTGQAMLAGKKVYQCRDCLRSSSGPWSKERFQSTAGAASTGTEYRRLLGYSSRDGAAPCSGKKGDD